jgi:hypothetical protein
VDATPIEPRSKQLPRFQAPLDRPINDIVGKILTGHGDDVNGAARDIARSRPAQDQISQALRRLLAVLLWAIRNSSIFRPDFMAATSQRGRLPRPDQVSEVCGFRYFGNTLGYLRRGFSPSERASPASPVTPTPRLRTARRFSSSRCSALIRADKMALILSWRAQSSSSDMDSNSSGFSDMLPHHFSYGSPRSVVTIWTATAAKETYRGTLNATMKQITLS